VTGWIKTTANAQTLNERETELKQLNGKYNQCAEHNARLYAIGVELMTSTRRKALWGPSWKGTLYTGEKG